jgi:Icc-related predicted phosphoesterase
MRIICVSDTYGLHERLVVPPGDVLIHAGNCVLMEREKAGYIEFNNWLGKLPHPMKILVPGNHDLLLEASVQVRTSLISNARVLVNELVVTAGLRIWGSPANDFGPGAFVYPSPQRRQLFEQVPEDLDILITHSPAAFTLDRASAEAEHCGDYWIQQLVRRVTPRLHVFGHVVNAYGITESSHTISVNACLLGDLGRLEHPPIVIDLVTEPGLPDKGRHL